jgi:hypothetical protein
VVALDRSSDFLTGATCRENLDPRPELPYCGKGAAPFRIESELCITLAHAAVDSGIPRESATQRVGISP